MLACVQNRGMRSHVKLQPTTLKHSEEDRSPQDEKFWVLAFLLLTPRTGLFHLELKSLGQRD